MEPNNIDYDIAPEIFEFRTSPQSKFQTLTVANHTIASNTAVHELLECPVCSDVMYPPIHQCPNGHTLCSKCQLKANCCPVCRQELGNIRCLALERVAESLDLPCKYQILGCQDVFLYHNRERHEQICRFRPYNCPYAGAECPITGDIPFLMAHLKNDHEVDMHEGCTFNHRYVKSNPQDIDNATWMLTDHLPSFSFQTYFKKFLFHKCSYRKISQTLYKRTLQTMTLHNLQVFNCYGHQFCLHFEAFNLGMAPVYITFVRFMGDDDDARNFRYSLEVGANGRKLTWQGVPRSIRDSHIKVRDSMDGLIIQRSMALFFSGGNGRELKLKVAGRIWKEHP